MNPGKKISILGSTGSIGSNALKVAAANPSLYDIVGLACGSDWRALIKQARQFRPEVVALFDEDAAKEAKRALKGTGIAVREGTEGLLEIASLEGADIVVSAIVGAAGVLPTYRAVEAGKVVALANKEALVVAGHLISAEAKKSGATLVPVDSEHSAVFQVLLGQDREAVRKVILTASGGPFFGKSADHFSAVTPEMALNHPRWKMGPKVTVDSATMMNKGLEVIEARWIFDLPPEKIEVLIHPQSVVHSMVEFMDGSVLAQMGLADMRIPISFALSYPERVDLGFPSLDLTSVGALEFFTPDTGKFPCLKLAYRALMEGKGMSVVMNAANEIAVKAFLEGALTFTGIPELVESVMQSSFQFDNQTIHGVLEGDQMARERAKALITGGGEIK